MIYKYKRKLNLIKIKNIINRIKNKLKNNTTFNFKNKQ